MIALHIDRSRNAQVVSRVSRQRRQCRQQFRKLVFESFEQRLLMTGDMPNALAMEVLETDGAISTVTAQVQTVYAPSEAGDDSNVMVAEAADPAQPFLVDDVTMTLMATDVSNAIVGGQSGETNTDTNTPFQAIDAAPVLAPDSNVTATILELMTTDAEQYLPAEPSAAASSGFPEVDVAVVTTLLTSNSTTLAPSDAVIEPSMVVETTIPTSQNDLATSGPASTASTIIDAALVTTVMSPVVAGTTTVYAAPPATTSALDATDPANPAPDPTAPAAFTASASSGTASGTAGGCLSGILVGAGTGAAVGAGTGVWIFGIGAAPGAIAGAIAGGIIGGVGGCWAGSSQQTFTGGVTAGIVPGLVGGVAGGFIGPGVYWYWTAPLYHYTTAAGGQGIVQTGVINGPVWATNLPPSIVLNPYTGPIAQVFLGWVGPYQVGTTIAYMPLTQYFAVSSATFVPSLIKIFQFYSQNPVVPLP